jgi:hypothetical protein
MFRKRAEARAILGECSSRHSLRGRENRKGPESPVDMDQGKPVVVRRILARQC